MIETLNVFTRHLDRTIPGSVLESVRFLYPYAHAKGHSRKVSIAAPGKVVVEVERDRFGIKVAAKLNLPRILYGEGAAAGSLPPDDIPAGVLAALRSVHHVFQGDVSMDPAHWKISRVDVNATFEMLPADASAALESVAGLMLSVDPDRALYGSHSMRARISKHEVVRVYDKSRESGLSGPAGGTLVRIEGQLTSIKARSAVGETLDDLVEGGSVMAQEQVARWLSRFGSALFVSAQPRDVVRLMISRGMDPVAAARLAGPALIMARDGMPGLVDLGVSQATAYRWAREIRSVMEGSPASATGYCLDARDIVTSDVMASAS